MSGKGRGWSTLPVLRSQGLAPPPFILISLDETSPFDRQPRVGRSPPATPTAPSARVEDDESDASVVTVISEEFQDE